jgi:hypothetical protein
MARITSYMTAEYKQKKFQEAVAEVEAAGYKMRSTSWEGFRARYDLTCPKKHDYHVQWSEFHRGQRCRKCHNESLTVKNPNFKGLSRDEHRQVMLRKFKDSLKAEGYIFDPNIFKYKGNRFPVYVTCPKSHRFETTWNSWQSGKRCRECFKARLHWSEEEVRKILEAEGCELRGSFEGALKKFKLRCSCGRPTTKYINDFINGSRCNWCAAEKAKETARLNRIKKMNEVFGNG